MAGLGFNDMYIDEQLRQQDPYVDNDTTIGTDMRLGSRVDDEYNRRMNEPGLVDNTLDIVAFGTPVGWRSAKLAGYAGNGLGEYVNMAVNRGLGLKNIDKAKIAFRPVYKNTGNILNGRKIKYVSPYYAEADKISSKNPLGQFGVNGESRYIANRKGQSPFSAGSTKRHEYNHNKWYRKYRNSADRQIEASRSFANPNIARDREYIEYLADASEINARAREMQYALNVLKKNPDNYEALDYLRALRIETEPFVDNFVKQYPDEMGKYILKGMDYLDNRAIRNIGGL